MVEGKPQLKQRVDISEAQVRRVSFSEPVIELGKWEERNEVFAGNSTEQTAAKIDGDLE